MALVRQDGDRRFAATAPRLRGAVAASPSAIFIGLAGADSRDRRSLRSTAILRQGMSSEINKSPHGDKAGSVGWRRLDQATTAARRALFGRM